MALFVLLTLAQKKYFRKKRGLPAITSGKFFDGKHLYFWRKQRYNMLCCESGMRIIKTKCEEEYE